MTKREEPDPPPPLCVYCSAPWTDAMVKVGAACELEDGHYGGSWVDRIVVNIEAHCESCTRLVYRKEVTQRGGYG
jgi:hypothetical protein